jgi:secreted protein with Ig-like and vWFA domain
MKHEENLPIDPELEARIVAWVLGEASPFEAAELHRRVAADPALAIFKRRIEAVHGLIGEAQQPVGAGPRLSAEKRAKLLAVIGEPSAEGTSTATIEAGRTVSGGPHLDTAASGNHGRRRSWRIPLWAFPAAACLLLGGFVVYETQFAPEFSLVREAKPAMVEEGVVDTSRQHSGFMLRNPDAEPSTLRQRVAGVFKKKAPAESTVARMEMPKIDADVQWKAEAGARASPDAEKRMKARSERQLVPPMSMDRPVELHAFAGESPREQTAAAPSAWSAALRAPATEVAELDRRDAANPIGSSSIPSLKDQVAAKTEPLEVFPGINKVAVVPYSGRAASSLNANGEPKVGHTFGAVRAGGGLAAEPGSLTLSAPANIAVSGSMQQTLAVATTAQTGGNAEAMREGSGPIGTKEFYGAGAASLPAAAPLTIGGTVGNAGGAAFDEVAPSRGTLGGAGRAPIPTIPQQIKVGAANARQVVVASAGKPAPSANAAAVSQSAGEDVIKLDAFEVASSRDTHRSFIGAAVSKLAKVFTPRPKRPEPSATIMGPASAPSVPVPMIAMPAAKPADAPIVHREPPVNQTLRNEVQAANEPFSTFSLHVSDVSFRLAQAALERGELPDPGAIRPEEFYNAFDYGDPAPGPGEPIACRIEQAQHPFLQQRNLVRIAMKVPATGRGAGQPLRLTVLLDTSGSMERADRVATIRRAFSVLASLLGPADEITLIGFARQPRLLADRVPGNQAAKLVDIIARTPAEGGTNLEEALNLAGQQARAHFAATAQNRIVVLTDGAANLGNDDPAHLAAQVEALRQQGIAFDACGIGVEGLDDSILEALTRKGDGRYYVINSPEEADTGFAHKLAGAFRPAAENVKLQVRFNPERVTAYRLIGFEQHRLRTEDFRNDKVDAAELAAEEAAVAVYQVAVRADGEGELGDVLVRFRNAASGAMIERSWTLSYVPQPPSFDQATPSMELAGTAALLADKLRGGAPAEQIRLADLAPVVNRLRGNYAHDSRVQQFVRMFENARRRLNE